MTELATVIRAYVIRKLGPLQQLDDCVQEALMSLHQARHTDDPARPFRPWLFAIVRNRTIDLAETVPARIRFQPSVRR